MTLPAPDADAAVRNSLGASEKADHFRPDIEGLRAVAILVVLGFHAGIAQLSGGFIGVDVFYVISGFLITGLLLREHAAAGRISLSRFYVRRARRLLPAALVVIALTVIGANFILNAVDFPSVAGDGAAAALYVANFRFALTATDYFAAALPPSPLLHYWSLGVEEQFYLIWPVLIIFGAKFLKISRLWLLFVVLASASFALSVHITDVDPTWAFYSLPTRAWQLALGALVAVGVVRLPRRWSTSAATATGLAGLALIVAAVLLISTATPFPGWAAAVPSVGTVLLIIAGDRPRSLSARLMATAPMRFFGRISYSLYLWHWPIIILVPQLIGQDSLAVRLALAAGSIGVAYLSTRFIEQPFRFRIWRGAPARRLLPVALGMSLAIAIASVASALGGARGGPALKLDASAYVQPAMAPLLSGPLPRALRDALIKARKDLPLAGCYPRRPTDTQPPDCYYGDPNAPTVVVFGDSHAAQWLPALKVIGDYFDWRIVAVSKPGCSPFDDRVWSQELNRPFTECDTWRSLALAKIAQARPALIIASSSHGYDIPDADGQRQGFASMIDQWQVGMRTGLARLAAITPNLVLIADTPFNKSDPVACLAQTQLIESCTGHRSAMLDGQYQSLEQLITHTLGVRLLVPNDMLCVQDYCPLIYDDVLVWRDRDHMTVAFSAHIAVLLAAHLAELGVDLSLRGAYPNAAPQATSTTTAPN